MNAIEEFTYRGSPRTSDEWDALAKVASGLETVPKDALRSLFMLGLVERHLGRICLSEHGRVTLGLSSRTPAAVGGSFIQASAR